MIQSIKLENYLPLYIQEYREMWKLMQAENPEFQLASDQSEVLKNNLFIETCDEKGISRFESIMGIYPLDTDTLQSRISRVLTRWNEKLPYTYFYLLSKLNSLCGTNNYKIVRNINKYEMDITTYLELSGQVEELDYLLNNIIPANILLKVKNKVNIETSGESNVAAGLIFCNSFELSDNFNQDFIVNTGDSFAGAILNTEEINISDNFNETININSNHNIGSAVINTIQINVTDNFNDNINIESNQNIGSILSVCENLVIGKE